MASGGSELTVRKLRSFSRVYLGTLGLAATVAGAAGDGVATAGAVTVVEAPPAGTPGVVLPPAVVFPDRAEAGRVELVFPTRARSAKERPFVGGGAAPLLLLVLLCRCSGGSINVLSAGGGG